VTVDPIRMILISEIALLYVTGFVILPLGVSFGVRDFSSSSGVEGRAFTEITRNRSRSPPVTKNGS